ncbi:STAS domain-containing protein [Peribacillus frigoritolerans]|uniref:STAS domain-containing protein n=1 Tax=Peribacillus frigoritolerans TaxID=450367 RepID=UPI000BEC48DC|nr:STAS domain-containing protein [Peribacillus frigoritolerans]MCR8869431.1 STAS domain-containing protein [Peribacillus frigoritolerans]PEF34822.1 RsbT co-antagonist protein RsbRB [Bacillus sp. AFS094228]
MHVNKELYAFLLGVAAQLTEDWYASLNKSDSTGVYSSTDPKVIKKLKQQNNEFHLRFFQVFDKEEREFFKQLGDWIEAIGQDEQHLNTPIYFILREFFRTQEQYLGYIDRFVKLHGDQYTQEEINSWYRIVVKVISEVMERFTEANHRYANKIMKAQQATIDELSTPIISLKDNTALLPLIGDIDTTRGMSLLENTLQKCAEKNVTRLFIDLSGVYSIDSGSAHQLSQLIESLHLIGIQTTLSGLRPEIAMTAVKLQLPFDKVTIKSTLAQAISTIK